MDQHELKLRALEFEEKAKMAKEEKNLDKAAEYFLKSAELYNKGDDERNYKFNHANHHSAAGKLFFFKKEYSKSADYFKNAENLFIELNLRDPAFYCAVGRINSLYKSYHNDKKKD